MSFLSKRTKPLFFVMAVIASIGIYQLFFNTSSPPDYTLKNWKNVGDEPIIARHFHHFERVKVRWNTENLFVESDGLPDHGMMIGIRSWQQQVPLPQPFTGSNAWQIPLQPKLADKPISAKSHLFRGAIALAANGVPIFNALNNRGEDAYLAGELDKWGGHSGRGDDYHYHIAPVHLEKIVGKGQPIAFALDGFPIYGLTEADGSAVGKLDEFNGHFDAQGAYHYHASKTYPYINGGMRGVVTVRGGQIEPQPRDAPLRPGLEPLRGAEIIDFTSSKEGSVLKYRIGDKTGSVSYGPYEKDSWKFTFVEADGQSRTKIYQRRGR
ncbi:MAG: YHYH protein [Planctomycetota bacterium]|nr:YHYH protein [Planctomycetota bacterium]